MQRSVSVAATALAVWGLTMAGCELKSPTGRAVSDSRQDTDADSSTGTESAEAGMFGQDQPASAPGGVARKIIYNGEIALVVEDFSPVAGKVHALVARFDALVAGSQLGGSRGRQRSGEWELRVPAGRFDDFVEAARQLGEVRSVSIHSREVTEEFYDVEARIRNGKQEEARLIELLDERTGELADVLAVEREIARVRGEIERMEGRMRVLSDLTTLATVTLRIEEIRDYQPERTLSFASRIRRSFDSSANALLATGQRGVLALVAAAPWMAVFALPVAVLYYPIRRAVRRR